MLLSNFMVRGWRNIAAPPMAALTEFSHTDDQKNVQL